jgi:putative tryptophan/tyrosine transport system substrate-binding protein
MRRIGVFLNTPSGDPLGQAEAATLLQGLQELGWAEGRNVRIEWRRYEASATRASIDADNLVALAPDVIVAIGGPILSALLQTGRAVPIVFAAVNDPVGRGYVTSLARPGGNVTGFANIDPGISPKWIELLKEIAPGVTRVLVLGTPGDSAFDVIQAVAPAMKVELRKVDASNREEIERTAGEFARNPDGGLIVTSSAPAIVNRELIVAQAAKYRLPAVYSTRAFVDSGGLLSYGPVRSDYFRYIAGYVDRILKGEKPGDLPVQLPTKFETVLNMKTARALGFDIPPVVFVRADEVVE